ncbi:MAG: anti-sigma factor family protein [Steroidobacteraceae bacterium]
MNVSDEMLMAYVDDELDGEQRAALERAIAGDPGIARRIERQRSLRRALRAAYDPVLAEPVPARLLRGTRPTSSRRWSVPEWTAIAASLIVGALVSAVLLHAFQVGPLADRGGQLTARGALAGALSTQLASRQVPGAPVSIGVTFLARSGAYCRTFTLRGGGALAGLACRNDGQWRIEALARSASASAESGAYRQAASPVPPAVLDVASSMMAGQPLDARAEAAARAKGWSR